MYRARNRREKSTFPCYDPLTLILSPAGRGEGEGRAQGVAMAKAALITGGAKGIGRAIGLDLAAAGWDIALCYRTSEREAAETASRITQAGRRVIAERCDVSDPAAAEAFVREV